MVMQQILGSLLPVFMLVYANRDPGILNSGGGFADIVNGLRNSTGNGTETQITNPLRALNDIPGATPLTRVNQLTSIPMLIVGLSNYVLVPASVAFGRRAVIVSCGLLSTLCTIWAGLSTSLESHLAARSLHAIGAGATGSLIPLIIQDMTFIHQRNRGMSVIWASIVRDF